MTSMLNGTKRNTNGQIVRMTSDACICMTCHKEGIVRTSKYPDKDGNKNRLCSKHAKEQGSHHIKLQASNQCRDCPADAKKEASYKDENNQARILCAYHSKLVGSYQVRYACRDCPIDAKRQSNYPDEHGSINKLCSKHSKLVGAHRATPKCRDCANNARYPDEESIPMKLCRLCVRKVLNLNY